MEMGNQDADPTADPVGDHRPDPSGEESESASDFYDADAPPFPELPEKPPKAPSMPTGAAGAVPGDAVAPASRQVRLRAGAAAVVALLAVALLRRRRRNAGRGRVGRRCRRSRRS